MSSTLYQTINDWKSLKGQAIGDYEKPYPGSIGTLMHELKLRPIPIQTQTGIEYRAVEDTGKELSILEIANYISMESCYACRTGNMDYNRGFNEALSTILQFIRIRQNEDMKKQSGKENENCC